MPNYRRNRVAGGCYFFTVALRDRNSSLLVDRVDVLRACVRKVPAAAPFSIDAWVVLPDHLHCIWTLPEGDDDFPGRWREIKKGFPRALGLSGVWQDRYWEHTIRDERDYGAHFDYVHVNPVKHGLVARVGDWPFSTFRRAVAAGVCPADWGGRGDEPAEAGERGGRGGCASLTRPTK